MHDIKTKGFDQVQKLASSHVSFNEVDAANDAAYQGQFEEGDCIIYAVPASALEEVLNQSTPYIPSNCLLVTFQSTQEPAISLLRAFTPANCSILGCHPLFGPSQSPPISSPRSGIVVLTEFDASHEKHNAFKYILEQCNLNVHVTTSLEHDELMAFTQAATHFSLLALADLAISLGIKDASLWRVKTTVFSLVMSAMSRVVRQTAGTTVGIQSTDFAASARKELLRRLTDLDALLSKGLPAESAYEAWIQPKRQGYELIHEEGLSLANLFLGGLSDFERLIERHRQSEKPFFFRTSDQGEVNIVRIVQNNYKDILCEDAYVTVPTDYRFRESDSDIKMAIDFGDGCLERYEQNGVIFGQKRKNRSIRKDKIKLIPGQELEEFIQSSLYLIKERRRIRKNKALGRSPEFISRELPKLVRGLSKCVLVETAGDYYEFKMFVDPRASVSEIDTHVRYLLGTQESK